MSIDSGRSLIKVPILFLIFNRLETTKMVFEAIRQAKPLRLYIAGDGPRNTRIDENKVVLSVRDYVLGHIDWDCEIKTLFRDDNLGCGKAISSAITWFFENEEMGIILEDDCLPNQSFFSYCEELLEYYKNDTRIFVISGSNNQGTWYSDRYDYFFSKTPFIWGWATWARAWNYYDINMSDIEDFIRYNNFVRMLGTKLGPRCQDIMYNRIKKEKVDTWDYQWSYTLYKNNGLACVPSKNLIKNIGVGVNATHHILRKKKEFDIYELSFPLKKNPFVIADGIFDKKFWEYNTILYRFLRKIIRRILKIA
ncbi:hemolytic protein HlpA [Spirochaetia bacterium]|nr:hemolytic protein HlpA [Spirochaetia bacterium]